MTNFILISGSGTGAGKTHLAEKLRSSIQGARILALADGIRIMLDRIYPQFDWFNTTQAYKDNTLFDANQTIRQKMISFGQDKIKQDPSYWVNYLLEDEDCKGPVVIVPDLRKISELSAFRKHSDNVVHFHVNYSKSKEEPFDNKELEDLADYLIHRKD